MADLLPDSRTRYLTGARPGPGGMWVPIYCGHCHADGGLVPEQNMTFVSWFCRECSKTLAPILDTMVMPDEVFWAKLAQEQLETYGRPLTEPELVQVVEADASPLATLINERRT